MDAIEKLRYLQKVDRLQAFHIPLVIDLLCDDSAGELSKAQYEAAARIAEQYPNSTEIRLEELNGELMPFQTEGVTKLFSVLDQKGSAFLADDMGLGKTIQAIAVMYAYDAFPAVVVCPASVKYNWRKEIQKWIPRPLRIEVLEGRSAENQDISGADVVIANYAILFQRAEQINKDLNVQMLIVDEFHKIKNGKTQRSKAVREIVKHMAGGYKLFMTGTPLLNRPDELWNPLRTANLDGIVAPSWRSYVTRFCGAYKNRWGWDTSGSTNTKELHRILTSNFMVRRKKEEVLHDLPALLESTIPVDIDNYSTYRKAEQDIIAWLGNKAVQDQSFLDSIKDLPEEDQEMMKKARRISKEEKARRAEHLVKIGELKQIAAEGKIKWIVQWIEDFLESGHKLVIFAHHKDIQKKLLDELRYITKCERIFGEDSALKRQLAVEKFQTDPTVKVMVASLKAAAEGITLTAGADVIFTELGWSPGEHDQAAARVHRIGQEAQHVNAYYFVGLRTIEEKIAELLDEKREVIKAVHDGLDMEHQESILNRLIDYLKEKAQ